MLDLLNQKNKLDQFKMPTYWMSKEVLNVHLNKHHQGYVNKLEKLICDDAKYNKLSLEDIITTSYKNKDSSVFNNSAQIWNHNLFWLSISENTTPSNITITKIQESFSSIDNFYMEFINKGIACFGSGWVWVVLDENNKLNIYSTSNAENPLIHNKKAIITCDLWEHSYYLQFQHDRKQYLSEFIKYINWDVFNHSLKTHLP